MTITELWTEKYRPKTIDGYVFRDEKQKKQVQTWIAEKNIPHLILSGTTGIGKTTLAKLILREMGVLKDDIMEINGSDNNGVDDMRHSIGSFIRQMPFGAQSSAARQRVARLAG